MKLKAWIVRSALVLLLAAAVFMLSVPRALPCLLSLLRPDVLFRGEQKGKKLYVTIDDAPSGSTALLLAMLKKHQVPATFFITGNRVHSDTQLSAIVNAGFSLGHHMRTMERCSSLPIDRFRADFDFTDHLIRRFSVPILFRPPSDFGTVEQMAYVRSKGYQPVMGTVFPLDHWIERPSLLAFLVRWLSVPGGIIIMHDGDQRGRITAQVLDLILPALKNAGYEFAVLVPQLPGGASDAK